VSSHVVAYQHSGANWPGTLNADTVAFHHDGDGGTWLWYEFPEDDAARLFVELVGGGEILTSVPKARKRFAEAMHG
jgi:hypothetical protein